MDIFEYIKKHFTYDSESGKIQRNDRTGGTGSYDHYGYLILKIKGKQFKAHRLAWFLHYGEMPKNVIDHINGIKDDNRISNLRDVKQRINILNREIKPNHITGAVGVYLDRTNGLKKKYAIRKNKKTYRFYTIEEAIKFKTI